MHSALMVYGTLMVFVTLNLFLILASSLLILLTSASLLLQFLMSEIKTANPENIGKLLRFVRSFLKCPFLDRSFFLVDSSFKKNGKGQGRTSFREKNYCIIHLINYGLKKNWDNIMFRPDNTLRKESI